MLCVYFKTFEATLFVSEEALTYGNNDGLSVAAYYNFNNINGYF